MISFLIYASAPFSAFSEGVGVTVSSGVGVPEISVSSFSDEADAASVNASRDINDIKTINRLIRTLLNIFNQNTLYIYHQFKNKFDYIVGNPPYIRIHNLDDETKLELELLGDDYEQN